MKPDIVFRYAIIELWGEINQSESKKKIFYFYYYYYLKKIDSHIFKGVKNKLVSYNTVNTQFTRIKIPFLMSCEVIINLRGKPPVNAGKWSCSRLSNTTNRST